MFISDPNKQADSFPLRRLSENVLSRWSLYQFYLKESVYKVNEQVGVLSRKYLAYEPVRGSKIYAFWSLTMDWDSLHSSKSNCLWEHWQNTMILVACVQRVSDSQFGLDCYL